jgi:serine/threonine-protein kinase
MAHARPHNHLQAPQRRHEPRESLRGTRIGEYVIEERIGSGGMGFVYRAVQPLIGKQVAVKVLRQRMEGSPEDLQRLLTEARAVNAISHRGIIDIFSFGSLPDGRQYIVMELLRGHSLEDELQRRGRLPAHEVLGLLEPILSALAAAHGAGVIHRDLKPSNVFLAQQPDGSREVKLLDFGLAKLLHPYADTPETLAGHMLGTPGYMAPEQILGRRVTPAADLYALGAVTFQLLTGQPPFGDAEDCPAVVMRQMEEEPPVPSSLEPSISPALDALLLQLLAREPGQRPASAEAVRQQLVVLRASLSPTVTPPPLPRPVPPRVPGASTSSRPRWVWKLAAGTLVLLGLGVGLQAWKGRAMGPRPTEEEATPPAPPPLAPSAEARPPGGPVQARFTPPERVVPSAEQLLEVTHQLEHRLLRAKPRGKTRRMAWELLLKTRAQARAVTSEAERRQLHLYLKAWEQKFLSS